MTKTSTTTENSKRTAFQLKGSLFTLTALQLFDLDSSLLQEQLNIMVQQAPKFFQYAPIVIDLQKINEQAADVNFSELVSLLRELKLIPVGVRGVNSAQRTAAMTAGLAILPEAKTAEPSHVHAKTTAVTDKATTHSPAIITSPSKVITQPVRSGQQIYAQGGDLIVITSVSPGAELLADGHIHIYGPLRGRALAGVTGDTQARIFCHSLEAELVSIAGHYWVSEDLKEAQTNAPVQIYLKDERLKLGSV